MSTSSMSVFLVGLWILCCLNTYKASCTRCNGHNGHDGNYMLNANHIVASLRASLQDFINIIQQPKYLGHDGVGILQLPLLVTTFPICNQCNWRPPRAFGMKKFGCIFGSCTGSTIQNCDSVLSWRFFIYIKDVDGFMICAVKMQQK